jgi:putative hydrolase of HD superfamily
LIDFKNPKVCGIIGEMRGKLLHFFLEIGKLKKLRRTGWVLRGVKDPESVTDHAFRVVLMGWIFGREKKLDYERMIKMALVHDLGEVEAGDRTPYDSLLPKGAKDKNRKKVLLKWPRWTKREKEEKTREKFERELKSLENMIRDLPLLLKKEIKNLWLEYMEGKTKEARVLRQLDKLENLIQALEYERQDRDFPIGPFWIELRERLDDPDLLKFMKALEDHFYKKR